MQRRLWRPEAANPIRISREGTVLDGGHRLFAAAALGIDLPAVVFYGEDNEDMLYIDGSYARKMSDNFILADSKLPNTREFKSKYKDRKSVV